MTNPTTQPMSPEQSALLTEFARSCKSAARSVSLYPGTHPTIGVSLGRLVSAAGRLAGGTSVALEIHPDMLAVDGSSPQRPDPAVTELAALFHDRLVGVLRIEQDADAEDWRELLLIVARSTEDLVAQGGVAKAWEATGRGHLEIKEIDYAEVLRERAGSQEADWDRVVAFCLKGDAGALDSSLIAPLLEAVHDSSRFGALLDRLQAHDESGGVSMNARVAALFKLLRATLEAAKHEGSATTDEALETMAHAGAHLTPDMLLALIAERDSATGEEAQIAGGILERMTDPTIASFVARSVAAEMGATDRLAQAFQVLVPEQERKGPLLELAHEEARTSELGHTGNFEELWQGAAEMLTSYSDTSFVSAEYARELSGARTQAIEVERLSDDPPERVQAWLSSVSESAVRDLDLTLVLDLLRLEADPQIWSSMAGVAIAELERRTALGEIFEAQQLADSLATEAGPDGREALREPAGQSLAQVSSGPLVRHVITNLRKANEAQVEVLNRLCVTIGPGVVKALAEALTTEEHNLAIRRVRELLLKFGAAGRQAVEQLKQSSNPSVRRTAIDLLRVFGGEEDLRELASMIDDADSQVQRESIRAIVQIASKAAYGVIERAAEKSDAARKSIVQQLIGLRDDRAIPPLCYVLDHTTPRGEMVTLHESIIEALAGLSAHPESTRALRQALHRGEWWAPLRTAKLRTAAAEALRRIGSPDTLKVLEEAAASGDRGVRKIARAQLRPSA